MAFAWEPIHASMANEAKAINLPEGWTCSLELKRGEDGTFTGRAQLIQGHNLRRVLVLTPSASREAAIDQFQRRIESYIAEQIAKRGMRIGPL